MHVWSSFQQNSTSIHMCVRLSGFHFLTSRSLKIVPLRRKHSSFTCDTIIICFITCFCEESNYKRQMLHFTKKQNLRRSGRYLSNICTPQKIDRNSLVKNFEPVIKLKHLTYMGRVITRPRAKSFKTSYGRNGTSLQPRTTYGHLRLQISQVSLQVNLLSVVTLYKCYAQHTYSMKFKLLISKTSLLISTFPTPCNTFG